MTTPSLPKWHITSQNLTSRISDTGTAFENVWEVNYVVDEGPATGTRGKVEIPAARYDAPTVKTAIDTAVYHLDKVAGL